MTGTLSLNSSTRARTRSCLLAFRRVLGGIACRRFLRASVCPCTMEKISYVLNSSSSLIGRFQFWSSDRISSCGRLSSNSADRYFNERSPAVQRLVQYCPSGPGWGALPNPRQPAPPCHHVASRGVGVWPYLVF